MSEHATHDDRQSPIPRWARELGAEAYFRLVDLLEEGWDTRDAMREAGVPDSKLRSVQLLAQKLGPSRRLRLFAKLKDRMLSGAVDLSPDIMRGLQTVCQMVLSPSVKESTQTRAAELMVTFLRTLTGMVQGDEQRDQHAEQAETQKLDVGGAVAAILKEYGVKPKSTG